MKYIGHGSILIEPNAAIFYTVLNSSAAIDQYLIKSSFD